jgi:ketosteroid isomerase-like protein
MSTSTPPTTPTIAGARERNEAIWQAYLRTLANRDLEGWLALWAPDGRLVVAFPNDALPPAVSGHDELRALMGAFMAGYERLWVSDRAFHQTDDPAVALAELRMHAELRTGAEYHDRYVVRLTTRGGRVAEVLEYFDPRAHARMLQALGFGD